jgi:tRNA pseudouridine32 synthase / 23S rRNA pseudouridine746 synthase
VPLHRIDRETAGIVLFSANPDTRNIYHKLFAAGKIKKIYEAIGTIPRDKIHNEWLIENRIEESEKWPMMKNAEGPVNARTLIRKIDEKDNWAKFRIEPFTGKGHQIRLHLQIIGSSIINDRYHPELKPEKPEDFRNPLQLIARQISFVDPINGEVLQFTSSRKLLF